MTLKQFVEETSAKAHDIHHLGRFSKRFALVYSQDEGITRTVIDGALRAMLSLIPHSLALLPAAFSLEDFILKQLSLSYLGEQRVAEPQKVRQLFQASQDYYLDLYPQVLAFHTARYGTPQGDAQSGYTQTPPDETRRCHTEAFLRRSRHRGILRWPKYMLTVENWLEYILDKLERHQGIKVELNSYQRRFPLIFGWPKYFELRRKGIVG